MSSASRSRGRIRLLSTPERPVTRISGAVFSRGSARGADEGESIVTDLSAGPEVIVALPLSPVSVSRSLRQRTFSEAAFVIKIAARKTTEHGDAGCRYRERHHSPVIPGRAFGDRHRR